MIQVGSHLAITDNTGGRFGKCIKVYGGNHAKIGDIILISLKKIKSAKKNQKFKISCARTKCSDAPAPNKARE